MNRSFETIAADLEPTKAAGAVSPEVPHMLCRCDSKLLSVVFLQHLLLFKLELGAILRAQSV